MPSVNPVLDFCTICGRHPAVNWGLPAGQFEVLCRPCLRDYYELLLYGDASQTWVAWWECLAVEGHLRQHGGPGDLDTVRAVQREKFALERVLWPVLRTWIADRRLALVSEQRAREAKAVSDMLAAGGTVQVDDGEAP